MKKKKNKIRSRFIVMDDIMEVKIYFCPKGFSISEHEVEMTVYTMVYGGYCTGAELHRLMNGEVRLYFNPTYHGKKARRKAIGQMINVIDAQSIQIGEEED